MHLLMDTLDLISIFLCFFMVLLDIIKMPPTISSIRKIFLAGLGSQMKHRCERQHPDPDLCGFLRRISGPWVAGWLGARWVVGGGGGWGRWKWWDDMITRMTTTTYYYHWVWVGGVFAGLMAWAWVWVGGVFAGLLALSWVWVGGVSAGLLAWSWVWVGGVSAGLLAWSWVWVGGEQYCCVGGW